MTFVIWLGTTRHPGVANQEVGPLPDVSYDPIIRAIGEELRRVRDQRGLTRGEVVARMSPGVSVQALANYEYGIRPVSVPRLVAICAALEVSAPDLLGLALQRAELNRRGGVRVDLRAVVKDRRPELRPLRRWARNRLAEEPDGPGVAHIDRGIIGEMAAFLGFTRAELVRHLVTFTPGSV
jgi:transcriptional regulator with XRE-family HTH domain